MKSFKDELPPEGEIVFTHIDDENGLRNETLLRRRGGLMYFPDDSMYIYYAPTHWRPATREELESERDKRKAQFQSTSEMIAKDIAAIDRQIATREDTQ